jgi:excisionase family DNA binding protein
MTIPEAAEALRVSESSVRRLIAAGVMTAYPPTPRALRIETVSVTALRVNGYQALRPVAEGEAA